MKRIFFAFLFLSAVLNAAFAQRIPVVGVLPVEAEGRSVTPAEAAEITGQIIAELSSWGSLNVLQDEAGAEYVVRSKISRQGNVFVLSAETIEASSKKKLNDTREQAAALKDIQLFSFCTKVVENVPLPNYMLGTWQSTLNMPDGPVVCIIEFKSDRTVRVERYDTWEHRRNNSLRYEGYGTGTYSYAGYFTRRTMTVNSQQIQVDATANVNLKLEETLPEQTNVSLNRMGLQFNGDKSSFEIIGGSFPCGHNYDGPSVYPSASIGFTRFTKIK
jgi:hypothetical protein